MQVWHSCTDVTQTMQATGNYKYLSKSGRGREAKERKCPVFYLQLKVLQR